MSFYNTAQGQYPVFCPNLQFKQNRRMIQYIIAHQEMRARWDEVECGGKYRQQKAFSGQGTTNSH